MKHTEDPGAQPSGAEFRPTEARQGVVLGRMRYVLGAGLILAIVAFAISYAVA